MAASVTIGPWTAPLPAGRRDEQIEEAGAEECPERQRIGICHRHESADNQYTQSGICDQAHQAGVEGILDQERTCNLGCIAQQFNVVPRRIGECQAEDHENHVEDIEL